MSNLKDRVFSGVRPRSEVSRVFHLLLRLGVPVSELDGAVAAVLFTVEWEADQLPSLERQMTERPLIEESIQIARTLSEASEGDEADASDDGHSNRLIHALRKLPFDLRVSLVLVDIEQLSVEEVSDIIEATESEIRKRVEEGRGVLRQTLSESQH